MIYATIAVGTFISAEAALTYLGIGLQAPEISWGLQINVAQSLIGSSPHLLFFPALFLSVTVLGFIPARRRCATPSTRRGVER